MYGTQSEGETEDRLGCTQGPHHSLLLLMVLAGIYLAVQSRLQRLPWANDLRVPPPHQAQPAHSRDTGRWAGSNSVSFPQVRVSCWEMGFLRPGVPTDLRQRPRLELHGGREQASVTWPEGALAHPHFLHRVGQQWPTVVAGAGGTPGGPRANTGLLPAVQIVPSELYQYICLLCPVTVAELTGCDREYVAHET